MGAVSDRGVFLSGYEKAQFINQAHKDGTSLSFQGDATTNSAARLL